MGVKIPCHGEANYIDQAGYDSSYFDMGDEFNRVLEAVMKELNLSKEDGLKYMFENYNAPFLDQGINNSQPFYFTSDPRTATGSLADEYQYLLGNGYELRSSNPFPNSSADTNVYYMVPKGS